ncbi:MAG: hypothetical protein CM15mP115_12300 [Alphaproteobacteria bacterium]|nr:MAG: hypothetical protein CM15mP115_12300 [Alphaproteobacteria bacterium]
MICSNFSAVSIDLASDESAIFMGNKLLRFIIGNNTLFTIKPGFVIAFD